MHPNLCSRVWAQAIADSHFRQPRWTVCDIPVPAEVCGRRSLRGWLLLGTGRRLAEWVDTALDFIGYEALEFTDAQDWPRQRRSLRDTCGRFFATASDQPALVWATPVWPIISHVLRRESTLLLNRKVLVKPVELDEGTRKVPLSFGVGSPLQIDMKNLLFHYPDNRGRSAVLHWVVRSRLGLRRTGEEVFYGQEELLYLARPQDDARWLEHAWVPALANFCMFDISGCPKWLTTYRVVVASLRPHLDSTQHAWIYQLSMPLHPGNGNVMSILVSRRSFETFVQQRPLLQQLLIKRTCGDGSHDEYDSSGGSDRLGAWFGPRFQLN